MNSFFAIGLCSVFALVGCAANSDSAEDAANDSSELAAVTNPSHVTIRSVIANGLGCRAGSWESEIARDGQSVDITFHQFSAELSPGQAFATSDCMLSLDVRAPSGVSYSIESLGWNGYAMLDEAGVKGSISSKLYFQGSPLTSERHSDLTGPIDDSFVFDDRPGVTDQVWSSCSANRRLNIQSRLFLQNNARKTGSGHIEVGSTTDDAQDRTVHIALTSRACH